MKRGRSHGPAFGYYGMKSIPSSIRATAWAISLAMLFTSPRWTISHGECMYRFGTEIRPVATPARVSWIAFASVPVPRGAPSI